MNRRFYIALATVSALILPLSARNAPEPIKLWPEGKAPLGDGKFENADPTITVFRPEKPNGTAFVIAPGGGYARVVKGEGAPIAKWLNTHGITGFVLDYRLPKGNPNRPLLDVKRALRMTRMRATDWDLKTDRIGIIGFSAGGHLASMAVTKYDLGEGKTTDPIQRESSRPDFAILVYPVITMGEGTHRGSRKNLLGAEPSGELIQRYSNELHITAKTPPTYLVHAIDDVVVPASNSEGFHKALVANKVPTKYLPLPRGGHGLNGYKGPMWDAWQTRSMEWLSALLKK
ncbi:MAG: alpha/beta hydrolase [Akkermansiaceae bacterium]